MRNAPQWLIKRIDILIIGSLVALTSFLTFYQLGNLSLHPWDEAWYATISRNVIHASNPLDLQYNQHPFWDHPPLGFYLTATSFLLLGTNEFAARAPQALLAVATIAIIYVIGKQLKNRWVGLLAALMVLSARWFLFRARSGNLDILLSFTQLSFFWAAFTTRIHKKIWLPALALSFALLSKTTISITLTPLLLWAWYERHHIKKVSAKELLIAGGALIGPLLPWYGYNALAYGPKFLKRSIFEVGLRSGSTSGVSVASITQTALYFHSAVHRWYSFFAVSIVGGGLYWLWQVTHKKFTRVRSLSWLLAYIFLVGFPYLLSAKTEIWHLIPLIAPFALLTALMGSVVVEKINAKGYWLLLFITIGIALSSFKAYWLEFINLPPAVSEAAALSKTIQTKNEDLYLSNDAFYPTIVYYANLQRPVLVVRDYEFAGICASSSQPFLYITTLGFLNQTHGWTKLGQQGELQLVEFNDKTCGPTSKAATSN